jgi:hypothetical protein
MEKRYQVFVSSTYKDLQDERAQVIRTLMEMDCFPAGMELFPAVDEEQWNFIKKIIDDCDYYILIVGGRYGSTTAEGLSYTEKEYDYAIEKGLKVLAFVHEDPGKLPLEKSEVKEELRDRLSEFLQKIKKERLIKFWNTSSELPGLVALSLPKTIKAYPAIGWVRANQVASTQLLSELNELRKHNQDLEKALSQFTSGTEKGVPENLASAEENFSSGGTYLARDFQVYQWNCTLTWMEIFGLIAPYLLEPKNDTLSKTRLEEELFERTGRKGTTVTMKSHDFQTIKVQFLAFGWIKLDQFATTKGGMALFWSLTSKGREIMMQARAVRSAPAS